MSDENWQQSIEQHRIYRQEKIIDAALELFLEKDFSQATMKEISVRSGMSRVTLYKYYKSIHDVAFDAEARVFRGINQFFCRKMAPGHRNGAQQLRVLFETYMEFFKERRDLIRFTGMFDQYYRGHDKNEPFLSHQAIVEMPIHEGIEDGSLRSDLDEQLIMEMVTQTIMGVIQRMAAREYLSHKEREDDSEEMLKELFQMIYHYVQSDDISK